MNRQRKIVVTVTYNDLGTIVDTKAEELDSSAQPNLQPTCDQLATDTISRRAAIDAIKKSRFLVDAMEKVIKLPPAQPERKKGEWIPYSPEGLRYKCSECESRYETPWHFCPNCGSYNGGGYDD